MYAASVYDASGMRVANGLHRVWRRDRRIGDFTSEKRYFGSQLNMITENNTGIGVDGDGRPVIEKRGNRTYHVNSPPSESLTPTPHLFQVWSSVLKSSLMTVSPDGSKKETKIFAGGAVIATQGRAVSGGQTQEGITWKTADPVTGTTGSFSYSALVNGASTGETEPFGQTVSMTDPYPVPEPEQPPNDPGPIGGADDPHWQCLAGQEFYGGFSGMPFHCQKKVLMDLSVGLAVIYGFSRKESVPGRINEPKSRPPVLQSRTKEETLRDKALKSSWKPSEFDNEADESTFDGTIPGMKDASVSGENGGFPIKHPQRWLAEEGNPNCFLNMLNANGRNATRIGRDFDPYSHNGRHAISPVNLDSSSQSSASGGNIVPIPLMRNATAIRWGYGDAPSEGFDASYYVDVLISGGSVIRILDMTAISSGISSALPRGRTIMHSKVGLGSIIGTASANRVNSFGSESGMGIHVTLVRPGMYSKWISELRKGLRADPSKLSTMLSDPLGEGSPINCPQYTDRIYVRAGQ